MLIGRAIKPGRVCSACARLGWLLVLGEDKPRPTTKRELERKLRGVAAVTGAFRALSATPLACDAHAPSGEQCELERGHSGKHSAPRRGSMVFSSVRWST